MAFENVFGNVDFGLPVRAANADRQYFAQMLGQGIQNAQFKQQMDMKERQLEQKTPDIGKLAENAVLKRNMGLPLTPQEEAAITTMGQTQRPQIYTDLLTKQTVIRPSPWSELGTISEFPQGMQHPQANRASAPVSPVDAQPLPPQPMPIANNPGMMLPGAGQPVQAVDDIGVTSYQAPPKLGGRGTIMEEEFKRGIAEKRADISIKEEAAKRKEIKGVPKKEKRILESAYEWQNTSDTIDEAIDMVSPFSAGVGTLTSIIPATPAKNLAAKLETVAADAAFGALQKMRDNSKTGGALGQVSERELSLLKSSQAPLDQAQSPAQLTKALTDYKDVRTEALRRVADAFEEDYGYRPKQIDELLKSKQKPEISREQAIQELRRRRGQ